jgi:penicillin-binding protein 1B
VGLVILVVSFLAGFGSSIRVYQLDRTVVARFEGRRFVVPSRVYSAPAMLYPGLDWKLVDLPGTLRRLGYREAARARALAPGQYAWGPSHARIHLRAFEHPSRPEPARDVVLRLDGNVVRDIRALPSGRELGAVALEPEQIGAYYGPDREQRELVSLGEVPRHLIEAVLAVEDQRFESHRGIDLRRIAGALVANLRAGSIREGGSTLTQQLVKNFFLTPERTLQRKLQEAVMAVLVELRYDKDQILEAYLNEIYLGQRGSTAVHGVGEAARLYFGKRARDLTLAESALLAAIIQSPNGISPHRAPERATQRRDLVLGLMHDQGRIEAGDLERARAEPLQLAAVTPDPGDARYFLDLVQRHLAEGYDGDVLTAEGLRIYSTLDRRVQLLAARSLREGLDDLEQRFPHLRRGERSLQGCIVAMRPQTGEILALVGGRDYRFSQFDRCSQARRPTGSVFKPFVYIAALEPETGAAGITLASVLDDSPLEIPTPSGIWRPENYDHEFHGLVGVRDALEHSYNVATARLAHRIGVARVADVARRLGITSPLPRVPSLALGAADVSPLEMVRAYATIASGGIRPEVQSVEDLVDVKGRTLERRRLQFERVLDPGVAFLAISLLEGVAQRGTAAGVHATGLEGPIAAKTGTSNEEHDLWFVGFTPDLVALVWVGFDEPRSLRIPSSVGALPIWRRLVTELSGGRVRGRFAPPAAVRVAEIEPSTGMLALDGCPERRREYFLAGTEPTAVCPSSDLASPMIEGDESPLVRRRFFEWLRGQL